MKVSVVNAPTTTYLSAVRNVLEEADEALMCVAFAQARGVHLVQKELDGVSQRGGARVVVTTTFGSSSSAALAAIHGCRADLRVLNPGGATFHPKVFLGRTGKTIRAVVGSANLTSGLVANVEAGVALEGTSSDEPLSELWSWAEGVWSDPRFGTWQPPDAPAVDEEIEPELLAQLVTVARENPTVYTLGSAPKPNFVSDVTASGLWVETESSRAKHAETGRSAAQVVTPRMLNLAWDALRARGRLTNGELLNELRVHRSSFVCGILARLPDVQQERGTKIALRYVPSK